MLLRSRIVRFMILSAFLAILGVGRYIFQHGLPSLSISLLPTRDIIDTGYVQYLGNRTFPNAVAYLGIPYAEPPLGERRFRAPFPLDVGRISKASKGAVVDATRYPDACFQGTTGSDAGGAESEDCLKVNVYAPVGAKRGSNLPVLVYIHGGGYLFGNPAIWPFDHWIHQSPTVVIVSVYYRLSSFGFLATPEFRDPANGDLNAGFLDQVEALRWVKRYIGAFGGDSEKVTINGESAGGSSVGLHLVANLEERDALFRGAIVQSLYRTPLPSPEQQEPLFNFYTQAAGCHAGSVLSRVACLRNSSVSALTHAQDVTMYSSFGSGYKVFHPVVDGKIITDFPTRSILGNKFARVPLIVGATTNETFSRGADVSTSLRGFFPSLSEDSVAAIEEAYPVSEFASTDLRFQTITGDAQFRCARTLMGEAFAPHSNVWTYRYNQPNPTSPGPAAGHAAENWMMFRGMNTGQNGFTTFPQMTPIENAFAEELIAYWLSFVRTGNPNTYKLARSPMWSSYTKASRMRIVLQEEPSRILMKSGSVLEVESEDEARRCALVGSFAAEMEN